MNTIVDLYQADGYQAKRVASTSGGEYAGPCPACGGEDRFHLWPETGRWWCRQCEKSGDAIQYLRDFRGMTFQSAKDYLGVDLPERPRAARPQTQPWTPPASTTPRDLWAGKAAAMVKWCADQLHSDAGAKAITYLTGRGLAREAIRAAGLGLIYPAICGGPVRTGALKVKSTWTGRAAASPGAFGFLRAW
ncbi:hypothetical protein KJ925_04940 [Patescibacteria group bacterium]|nr:hypothetical protein [Patescibacteria group bacterium]